MANGFTNAFGPMNQAWNRLNRTIAAGPQMKQRRLQNQLTQNKLNAYQKKQEQQTSLQNALSRSKNPTKAMFEYYKRVDPMKARDLAKGVFDEAKQIHNYGSPEQAANYVTENLGIPVKYQGGDAYDIQIQDGNIIRMHAEDQDGAEAPEMLQNGQWVPMQGNELQQPKPGMYQGRQLGETRPYYNNGKKITQEWTRQGWKELGTTPQWKPDAKKTPTPQKALRRTSQIRKAIATIDKTNEVTQAIIAANPNLKDQLGQKLNESQKQDLMDAWQNELDYYEPYLPERTEATTEPTEQSGLTEEKLQKYRNRYPGRTDEEIREAYSRLK